MSLLVNGVMKRNALLFIYGFLTLASIGLLTRLKFTFDFEQFFPQGDPEWEFFKSFIKDFETDDNFLLIAVERPEGVFDSAFLEKFHRFTLDAGRLPHVTSSFSLTKIRTPVKTPFGITTIPMIHLDRPELYDQDRTKILNDRRLVHSLISEDATALTVVLKTVNQSSLPQGEALMAALDSLQAVYQFPEVHRLGRAYFQRDLVWMEKREVIVSTAIAALLAAAVIFFIFRRAWMVFIAMTGIGLALLFFLGLLSALGRELNALAALYPILMCIVGVADTIHLASKYLDELEKGRSRAAAMRITVKEIGKATLITCFTTAIGFASLVTNRTAPIQGFGINSAIGVIVAFVVIYGWLWAMLPRFYANQLIKPTPEYDFWGKFMDWLYYYTKRRSRAIIAVGTVLLGICLWGVTKIHTNYRILNNMPRGQQITADFKYFEREFSGFRPLEIAVFAQNGRRADDFAVLKEMEKVEDELRKFPPVRTSSSINDLYRSLYSMEKGNRMEYYRLPDSLAEFQKIAKLAKMAPPGTADVLLSRDGTKARISSRIQDVGRDQIAPFQLHLEQWWANNTDSTVARFKLTGTGLIFDKNAAYIRDNMLQGLIPSVLIVALLMGLLYRQWRIVLVFLVPNVFPLVFAGALLGFLDIPLEAGIATVFSIVFGIATDDTIHFLSTFRLCRTRGMTVEQALHVTLKETGKAMCLSSIILFFSFLVMLFSIHPTSVTVGLLVSVTLAGALFCDLFLAPVLIRWLIRDDGKSTAGSSLTEARLFAEGG